MKPFVRTVLWILGVIGLHTYVSIYFYNYSPIEYINGVRIYTYSLRDDVWIVSLVGICLYFFAIAFFFLVLRSDQALLAPLQRQITLGFVLLTIAFEIAGVTICVIYREFEFVWISLTCLMASLLFAMILCCDCWRDELEGPGEETAEMVNRVVSARTEVEEENAKLEAELAAVRQLKAENKV